MRIITQPFNYFVLLGLLVIGFFTRLDYTDRWGCIIGGESIFDLKNILFSTISIILIFTSFLLKPRILKLSIVFIELVFWIFKLFYFKGGYVVSIAAAPNPIILFYDFVTLALRFFIICSLLKSNIRAIYIFICTVIIMAIKVFGFPTQFKLIIEENKSLQKAEFAKQQLTGIWTGTYEYDFSCMNETTHVIDTAIIRFDSSLVTLFDFRAIDSVQLFMEFDYGFSGRIHERNNNVRENYYHFLIKQLTTDYLELTLMQSRIDYRFKLTKSAQ